jgi:hypothetical protein
MGSLRRARHHRVIANPGGSDTGSGGEFLEIYNTTGRTIDLGGLILEYSHDEDAGQHSVRDATIAAGDYMVFGAVLPEFKEAWVDYGMADLARCAAPARH